MRIELEVNGQAARVDVEPRRLLVEILRNTLGLTGTKVGCDTSSCGACTVLLNGEPVKSCTLLAVQAHHARVTTIEGLTPPHGLNPVQEAFHQEHGLQCGFCTPGMVVSVIALLARHTRPDDDEIREALEGNLCRCTGYVSILRAVRHAAAVVNGETPATEAGRSLQEPLARRQVEEVGITGDEVEVV